MAFLLMFSVGSGIFVQLQIFLEVYIIGLLELLIVLTLHELCHLIDSKLLRGFRMLVFFTCSLYSGRIFRFFVIFRYKTTSKGSGWEISERISSQYFCSSRHHSCSYTFSTTRFLHNKIFC